MNQGSIASFQGRQHQGGEPRRRAKGREANDAQRPAAGRKSDPGFKAEEGK